MNQSVYLQLADADTIIYMIISGKYTDEELKEAANKYHKKWNEV